MFTKKKVALHWLTLIFLFILLVWPVSKVQATSEASGFADTDIVRFGQNWTLKTGETLDGDVILFGGNATIEPKATLKGDLAVIAGNAQIAGTVTGDVSVIGGELVLQDSSRIQGDVSVVGGKIQSTSNARIDGDVQLGNLSHVLWSRPLLPMRGAHYPDPGSPEWILWLIGRTLWGIFSALLTAIVVALIGILIVSIWPHSLQRVVKAVVQAPMPSFFAGLASTVAVIVLAVLLMITVCLLPFGLLLLLAWLGISLFGWTAVGYVVGQQIWDALRLEKTSDVLPTGVGVFLITLLSAIPCIGTLFALLMGMIGIGGVLLTQFGTRLPQQAAK